MSIGELAPARQAPPLVEAHGGAAPPAILAKLRADFDQSKTPAFAGDLLSTAISLGRLDLVRDVANEVLKWDPARFPSLAQLAKRAAGLPIIEIPPALRVSNGTIDSHPFYPHIRRIKQRLRDVPRNAFDWMDAALLYESLGQQEHAERAVKAALFLARQNRFVVRSAASFWIHRQELDKAHGIVLRTPGMSSDPWLVAAEIATAEMAEEKTGQLRRAKTWVESGDLHPFHASEMASAVATAEIKAGNKKGARRLFRASLIQPTENAIAQAAWVDRHFGVGTLWEGLDPKMAPDSPEAVALSAASLHEWDTSLGATREWLIDQPFSARPVINASFLYTTAKEDFAAAINVCRFGLQSNPHDVVIRNNLAFSLALSGKLDDADLALRPIHVSGVALFHQAMLSATHGLIAFRRGHLETGRHGYGQAIEQFSRQGLRVHELRARLMLAIEEVRSGNQEGRKTADAVMVQARHIKDPGLAADVIMAERRLKLKPDRAASK